MTRYYRPSPISLRRPHARFATYLVGLFLLLAAHTGWAQLLYKSTSEPVAVLELFTSEGCSSCPPAEHWVNNLTEAEGLWEDLFPVAFHVDYWDYLGWDDPFASSEWSNRQRRHRQLRNTSGVYTPGMLISGYEWHGWRRNEPPPRLRPEGELVLRVSEQTGQFTAKYEAQTTADQPSGEAYELRIALLGFGLETQVKAGENRGRFLTHDFVVLDMLNGASAAHEWRGPLPDSPHAKIAKRLAVVAWVSKPGTQRPLQVVGGWLPASVARQ